MEANAALRENRATLEKIDSNSKSIKKFNTLNPKQLDNRDNIINYEEESTQNTPNQELNKMNNLNKNTDNPNILQDNDYEHQHNYIPESSRQKNFVYFSDLYKSQEIPSKERFLFLFNMDWLANQFLCGCSLTIGVQIISIIFMAASISKFFSVFPHDDIRKTITAGILFLVYFIASYCFIYSSIYYNADYAYRGLVIYTIIFYFIVLDNLLFIFFVSFGILNPLGALKSIVNIILLSLTLAVLMLVHLYFLWICYSFWMHLKNKNYELIKGNFYRTYEEYDNLNFNRNKNFKN